MSKEDIVHAGNVSDRVQGELRQGNNDAALRILEQNYGPLAKNLLERVLDKKYFTPEEVTRFFGKISDFFENVVKKVEKFHLWSEQEAAKQKKLDAESRERDALIDEKFDEYYAERAQSYVDFREECRDVKRNIRKGDKPTKKENKFGRKGIFENEPNNKKQEINPQLFHYMKDKQLG